MAADCLRDTNRCASCRFELLRHSPWQGVARSYSARHKCVLMLSMPNINAQIFADCAFLRPDSLLALARAVVWAAAAGVGADGETDTAEVGFPLRPCRACCLHEPRISKSEERYA